MNEKNNNKTIALDRTAWEAIGDLNTYNWRKSSPYILLLLKLKIVLLAWTLPNLCNASTQSNNLAYNDETKKMTINSQIVRAKENLKLSHSGLVKVATADDKHQYQRHLLFLTEIL